MHRFAMDYRIDLTDQAHQRLAHVFAKKHNLVDELNPELMSFALITKHRKADLSNRKEEVKEISASDCIRPSGERLTPPSAQPTVPAYPNKGFQYKGPGPEVALELCMTGLEGLDRCVRDMDGYIANFVTEPVLWTVAYAMERGLIPVE